MAKWLVKSEPDVYSIDDLKREQTTAWSGVRNYQARNFLSAMKKGELVLFYHSSAEPPGVAGICKVAKMAYPDPTQFDRRSEYFDEKASPEKPRWFAPDLAFVKRFKAIITLDFLRKQRALQKMVLLQRGSRLSVQPVTEDEFHTIVNLRTSD